MSLLLDALKKAAKDKQNASAQNEAEHDMRAQESNNQNNVYPKSTLDQSLAEGGVKAVADALPDGGGSYGLSTENRDMVSEQAQTTTSTVSDEALQILVYKTNREYRRKQKLVWGAVTVVSVLILLTGGYYFYNDMVNDIEFMERKYRVAIHNVNAETIKTKKPELIADLTNSRMVGGATVAQAAVHTADRKKTATAAQTGTKSEAAKIDKAKQVDTPQFTRSRQTDPVSDLLQQGWQAYNRSDYVAAAQLYRKALQRESKNRDALLGMAAIAMQKKRYDEAKSYYARLLKLDPRDAIAVAALASLKQAENIEGSSEGRKFSELSESRLKMLLKQQPDSAPINFALGNLNARQKKWPQAQGYYFAAYMADESNPDYAFNLAVSLDQIGKYEQAAQFYRHSLLLVGRRNHGFSVDAVKRRLKMLEQQP